MASEEFRSSPKYAQVLSKAIPLGTALVQYYVIDGQAIFEGDIVLDSVDGMERLVAEAIEETGVAARASSSRVNSSVGRRELCLSPLIPLFPMSHASMTR